MNAQQAITVEFIGGPRDGETHTSTLFGRWVRVIGAKHWHRYRVMRSPLGPIRSLQYVGLWTETYDD